MIQFKQEIPISDDVYALANIDYNYVGDTVTDASNDPLSIIDSYSVWNARLIFKFVEQEMDLILWGRNITEEEYYGGFGTNAAFQEGRLVNFYAEPATYGLTFRKNF